MLYCNLRHCCNILWLSDFNKIIRWWKINATYVQSKGTPTKMSVIENILMNDFAAPDSYIAFPLILKQN